MSATLPGPGSAHGAFTPGWIAPAVVGFGTLVGFWFVVSGDSNLGYTAPLGLDFHVLTAAAQDDPDFFVFFGDTIYEDGSIPADRVIEAMSAVEADNPMEALHQALHELAAFALFAATTTLPRDQELSLSRDVNARLKRIRA